MDILRRSLRRPFQRQKSATQQALTDGVGGPSGGADGGAASGELLGSPSFDAARRGKSKTGGKKSGFGEAATAKTKSGGISTLKTSKASASGGGRGKKGGDAAASGGGGAGNNLVSKDYCQADEIAVRNSVCSFNVKYLGACEVAESRGMVICEGALQILRTRKQGIKAVLYVSGDGIRVVDQTSGRGLILDQTIEKVSFCAPDRGNEKGFAYICRDGTSRRWMCHGFHAIKENGARLSHAVGCAFTVCLEKKRKRDAEIASQSMQQHEHGGSPMMKVCTDSSVDEQTPPRNGENFFVNARNNPAYATTTFRRQLSVCERKLDPQRAIIVEPPPLAPPSSACSTTATPRSSAIFLHSSMSMPFALAANAHASSPLLGSSSSKNARPVSARPLSMVAAVGYGSSTQLSSAASLSSSSPRRNISGLNNFRFADCSQGNPQQSEAKKENAASVDDLLLGFSPIQNRNNIRNVWHRTTLHNEPIYEGDDAPQQGEQEKDDESALRKDTTSFGKSKADERCAGETIKSLDVVDNARAAVSSHQQFNVLPIYTELQQSPPPSYNSLYKTAPNSMPALASVSNIVQNGQQQTARVASDPAAASMSAVTMRRQNSADRWLEHTFRQSLRLSRTSVAPASSVSPAPTYFTLPATATKTITSEQKQTPSSSLSDAATTTTTTIQRKNDAVFVAAAAASDKGIVDASDVFFWRPSPHSLQQQQQRESGAGTNDAAQPQSSSPIGVASWPPPPPLISELVRHSSSSPSSIAPPSSQPIASSQQQQQSATQQNHRWWQPTDIAAAAPAIAAPALPSRRPATIAQAAEVVGGWWRHSDDTPQRSGAAYQQMATLPTVGGAMALGSFGGSSGGFVVLDDNSVRAHDDAATTMRTLSFPASASFPLPFAAVADFAASKNGDIGAGGGFKAAGGGGRSTKVGQQIEYIRLMNDDGDDRQQQLFSSALSHNGKSTSGSHRNEVKGVDDDPFDVRWSEEVLNSARVGAGNQLSSVHSRTEEFTKRAPKKMLWDESSEVGI